MKNSEFQIIKAKDLATLLSVSKHTAEKYIKDIKEDLSLKVVMLQHVKKYFNLQ